MKTNIKQMYVAIELVDSQVKILVSEYFNTRFNIVKLHKANLSGLLNHQIINKPAALKSIQDALVETSEKLGARIEKCVLVIPPYKFKRMPLKVNVNTVDGSLRKEDISRAVNNALKINVDHDLIVVDVAIIKYTVNGIASRRFPEDEICDEVLVDIDLLLADKQTTFDYVTLLEESGIKVVDICLSSYAIAKEAALLEQGLSHNLILLNIGKEETELSLISKGKLVTTEILNEGFDALTPNEDHVFKDDYKGTRGLYVIQKNTDSRYYDIDPVLIKQTIKEYLGGEDTKDHFRMMRNRFDDTIFGVDVYDALLKRIDKQLHEEEPDFDIRALHIAYDHKVLMLDRLKYLMANEVIPFDQAMLDQYSEVVEDMLAARNLLVRISVTGEIEAGSRIADHISSAREKDVAILTKVMNLL